VKRGKKRNQVQWIRDPAAGNGKIKSKKISIAQGLPADSAPSILHLLLYYEILLKFNVSFVAHALRGLQRKY
jgi:hypothetical protein